MELNNFANKISIWLTDYLKSYSIISELFLIGSVLDQQFEDINDVDILQKLNESNKMELLNYSFLLKHLKTDFQKLFHKSLHITTFTSNEYDTFDIFIDKNKNIKLL